MVGRTNVCQMMSKVCTVTLYGAKSEKITYSGSASGSTVSGSVTLDTSGQGSVTLGKGTYSFTAGSTGYAASNISVKGKTMDVYCRPKQAGYWFGVEINTLIKKGNYLNYYTDYVLPQNRNNSGLGGVAVQNSFSGCSKVKILYSNLDSGDGPFVAKLSSWSTLTTTKGSAYNKSMISADIVSGETGYGLTFHGYSSGYRGCRVYAIYGE